MTINKQKNRVVFLLSVLATLLVVMYGIMVFSRPEASVLKQDNKVSEEIANIVPNYQTKIGKLPTSYWYSLKLFKEKFFSVFLFGNSKTKYLTKNSQTRLLEALSLIQADNVQLTLKTLDLYKKSLESLKNRDLTKQVQVVNQNYALLMAFKAVQNLDPGLDQEVSALALDTNNLVKKLNPQPANIVSLDWVEGMVTAKDDYSVTIDYQGQKLLVNNANRAIYLTKNNTEIKNAFDSITIGSKIGFAPIGGQISISTDGIVPGVASAEKIMIGGK